MFFDKDYKLKLRNLKIYTISTTTFILSNTTPTSATKPYSLSKLGVNRAYSRSSAGWTTRARPRDRSMLAARSLSHLHDKLFRE